MRRRKHPNIATAVVCVWCASSIAVLAKALHYGRAAHRDEDAGFPCTAAIEWRHAAELFDPNTLAAEYCWRQWERIMQLPRRLADPISDRQIVASPMKPASTSRPTIQTGTCEVSLAYGT